MSPKRVQMTRNKPWRDEHPDAVIVDRRTKWGNPWREGDTVWTCLPGGEWDKHPKAPLTREQAIESFRNAEEYRLSTDPHYMDELRGKDLACWCKPDDPCHADVLIELANPTEGDATDE